MKSILVLKHMPSQNPGIFREFATQLGVHFNEIDLHAGDPVPDLKAYDGLWAMGGSMDVWQKEEYPWLSDEIEMIRALVDEAKLPFLGICLGHQLLAEAMGGKVAQSKNLEIGLCEIFASEAGKDHPLLKGLPDPSRWVNVHRAEITQPPPQAVILAHSSKCSNHIMEISDLAYSCQFHPEVCDHTIAGWMKIPGIPEALDHILGKSGVNDFHTSIAAHLEMHNRAAIQLFRNWLSLVYAA